MALVIDLPTTPVGLAINGAYARIAGFFGTKDRLSVDVAFYASEQSRLDDARELDFQRHELGLTNGATLAEMYTTLKALPAFSDAKDA